jgi:hypothetical protein
MDTIEKTFLECEELARERLSYISHISDVIKHVRLMSEGRSTWKIKNKKRC